MAISDIMGKISGKPKTQVALTTLGKEKMEEKGIDQSSAEGKVLWHLKEHTQSNLSEIAEDTGLNYWKVKDITNKLSSQQWRWIEWV